MADATTADTANAPDADAPQVVPDAEPAKDLQAEVDKWQAKAQEWEKRAKGNTKKAQEADELLKSQMSAAELSIAEARTAGRSEMAAKVVNAELRAAAVGRTFDSDALLALDRTVFLTSEGDVDSDAISAWVDQNSKATVEPEAKEPEGPLSKIDLGQGTRPATPIGDDAAFARILGDKVGAPRKL